MAFQNVVIFWIVSAERPSQIGISEVLVGDLLSVCLSAIPWYFSAWEKSCARQKKKESTGNTYIITLPCGNQVTVEAPGT